MENIQKITEYLIKQGEVLRDKNFPDTENRLDYVCVFCQNEEEFAKFNEQALAKGKASLETSTGTVYTFTNKFPDENGTKLLKIRTVDSTRPQRGDVDFYLPNYSVERQKLIDCGMKVITRPNMEMLELIDPDFDTLLYFSHPPLSEELGVKY